VQQIHDTLAVDGDTITLPVGRFSWRTHVSITKGITIQGQTTVNSDTGVCNDATVLLDDLTQVPGDQGFFHCELQNKPLRITGITFTHGARTDKLFHGFITVSGTSNQVRIDHLHVTALHLYGLGIYGSIFGVADHIVEDHMDNQEQQSQIQNGGAPYGDLAWSQPAGYGGPNFFFFEDWYINNTGNIASANGGVDGRKGCKFVVRNCHLYDVEILCHGTEAGRDRGGRAQEIYNNDYHWSHQVTMDGIRSGSLLVHDNTFYGVKPNGWAFQTYRSFYRFGSPFGGATGRNGWDLNNPTLYASGNLTSVNISPGDFQSITDANKQWTINQWVGYTAVRSDGCLIWITSNTAHKLTGPEIGLGGPYFAAGDHYEIRRVQVAIDQPNRGQGDLLSGDNPTPRQLNQIREPSYSWNNVFAQNGSHINFDPAINPPLQEGLDYFNDNATPGYTPYTYPHPLVNDLPRAVLPDVNGDGSPDFLLQRNGGGETAIWYLNNNVRINGDYGPTLPAGWSVTGAADFDGDGHADYALSHSAANFTAIAYMSGPTVVGAAWAPTLPSGWKSMGTADFNGDGKPDYVLFNASSRRTAIWYLNNSAWIGGEWGPTIPIGWNLIGVADFDHDGHPDYLLFQPSTHATTIWYLSGPTHIDSASGPTVPDGWVLVGTADFDGDGNPDFLLYNIGTRETAMWYLNDNVFVSSASGPTLPGAWGWPAR
jgi:hypothetical protein